MFSFLSRKRKPFKFSSRKPFNFSPVGGWIDRYIQFPKKYPVSFAIFCAATCFIGPVAYVGYCIRKSYSLKNASKTAPIPQSRLVIPSQSPVVISHQTIPERLMKEDDKQINILERPDEKKNSERKEAKIDPLSSFDKGEINLRKDTPEMRKYLIVQLILRIGGEHFIKKRDVFLAKSEESKNNDFVTLIESLSELSGRIGLDDLHNYPDYNSPFLNRMINSIISSLAKLYFSDDSAGRLVKDIASTFLDLPGNSNTTSRYDFIIAGEKPPNAAESKKILSDNILIFHTSEAQRKALIDTLGNLNPENRLNALLEPFNHEFYTNILLAVLPREGYHYRETFQFLARVICLLPSNAQINILVENIHVQFHAFLDGAVSYPHIQPSEKFESIQFACAILARCSYACRLKVFEGDIQILKLAKNNSQVVELLSPLGLESFKIDQPIVSKCNQLSFFNFISTGVMGGVLNYMSFKDLLKLTSCSKAARDMVGKEDKHWKEIEAGKLILSQGYITLAAEAASSILFHSNNDFYTYSYNGLGLYLYVIKCLRTKEGLQALGSKDLTINNALRWVYKDGFDRTLERFLFSKNGPAALKFIKENKINIPDEILGSDVLLGLLSGAGFAAWKRGLFVSSVFNIKADSADFYYHFRYQDREVELAAWKRDVNKALESNKKIQYTFRQLLPFCQPGLGMSDKLQYLFSPLGIEALEEGLITLIDVFEIKVYELEVILSAKGVKALRENLIAIKEVIDAESYADIVKALSDESLQQRRESLSVNKNASTMNNSSLRSNLYR